MLILIDLGASNLNGIRHALNKLGVDYEVTDDPDVMADERAFVLPWTGPLGPALDVAEERGIPRVALSGGVVYNRAIRETIVGEVRAAGLELLINRDYPLGDGCISFGQVVYGGSVHD